MLEGEEPTNEFRDKSFQKYDAVVTNAPLTATTKQLGLMQLLAVQERTGIKIPPKFLLDDITIQDKDKLIELIEQQQQQESQQQQQMAELQMENQRIVNESLQSKAYSDRALADERLQKGQLEQFQIMTAHNKSEHEKAAATLDMVKAAREVQSMDVDDMVKVFSLIENIQKRQDENQLREIELSTSNQGKQNGT